jgi:hypothetical protein
MKTILSVLALVGGFLVLAGCTTPETRIKKNPEAFSRLTPAQQQAIREGRVELGFDMEMVKLALGDPDRMRERVDKNGRSEVWEYVTYASSDGAILYRGWYHRGWRDPMFPYYLDYGTRREIARDRVVFREGKVESFEREKS